MRYEMMLPHHIKTAIDEDWPVVLALGPLEYHGQHMSVGMDTLAVVKTVERLEQEMDMVVLPTFYYGPASYAVEPPEFKGSIQVEAEHLIPDRLSQYPLLHPPPVGELLPGHAYRSGLPHWCPPGHLRVPGEGARRRLVGQQRDVDVLRRS
jgi:hypothetical protein